MSTTTALPGTGAIRVLDSGQEKLARQARLYDALAAAQGSFTAIPRSRTVTVQTNAGPKYSFSYAPLEVILDHVRPALAANGLALSQATIIKDGQTLLRTSLFHADGGELFAETPLQLDGLRPQEQGSLRTYMRRYAIQEILGIATEEDDDANAAEGNTTTPRQKPERKRDERFNRPGSDYSQHKDAWAKKWNSEPAGDLVKKVVEMSDPEQLRLLWEIESEREKPRKTLLNALLDRLKQVQPETIDPPSRADTVGEGQAATPDGESAVAPDPGAPRPVPLSDALKIKAALHLIQDTSEKPSDLWTIKGVLLGLDRSGAGVYGTIEEVPVEWQARVWEGMPEDKRKVIGSLGPEALQAFAEKAK